jgi:hypothetical protein
MFIEHKLLEESLCFWREMVRPFTFMIKMTSKSIWVLIKLLVIDPVSDSTSVRITWVDFPD